MERKKALKQVFEILYEQSSEHNLEKTFVKYSFNRSKLEESKLKLSTGRSTSKNTGKDHRSSWKIKVYGRVKSSTTSRKRQRPTQRQDLRGIVDKLHLSNIVGRKTQVSTPRQPRSKVKRRRRSDIFLMRNIQKVRRFLEVSNTRESSPAKGMQKKTQQSQFAHSNSSTIEKKVNLVKRSNIGSRAHARLDKTFDSGFYEFNEGSDSTDQDDVDEQKCANEKKSSAYFPRTPDTPLETSPGVKSSTDRVSRDSYFNFKRKRHPSCAKKKGVTQSVLSEQKQTEATSNVQSNKILFKPLFGNHCGNTWKQIVDEN